MFYRLLKNHFSVCKKDEVSKSDLKIHITFHYVNLLDNDRLIVRRSWYFNSVLSNSYWAARKTKTKFTNPSRNHIRKQS